MARSYAASAVAVYILSQEPSENFEPEAVVVKPRKVFAKKDLSQSALRTLLCFTRPRMIPHVLLDHARPCFPLDVDSYSQRNLEPMPLL